MAPNFKVLIAGGGVAGLTLANMLERFGLDYLILESHGDIAPQVGASIGLFPNGLRILDQMGCYEPIKRFLFNPEGSMQIRDFRGKAMINTPGFIGHLQARLGYPLLFLDRQWLLQMLYDHLEHKDRVLMNHKVTKVEHTAGGVEVTTNKGEKFHGSLLIGADGVHSSVRKEMYRIGDELHPGYFPENEQDRTPCYYLCMFGIAQDVPGWIDGDQCTVLGEGHSQLIVSGPDRRVYFFLFSRLPEIKYGKDIPRCSEKMQAEFAEKYASTLITEKVTFGSLYDRRISATLTPLHEFVCEKWFFKRIMIMGDAASKPNPLSGQGGNGAIEAAADFMNALLRQKIDGVEGLGSLSDKDVHDVLSKTQKARRDRAKLMVDGSHLQQALSAFENPVSSRLGYNILLPLTGYDFPLMRLVNTSRGATRLKSLPLVQRPRAVPFDDERPAKPLKWGFPVQLLFAIELVYLLLMSTKTWSAKAFDPIYQWSENGTIAHRLTTTAWIARDSSDLRTKTESFYTVTQLISPAMIYMIESYRVGHKANLLALGSVWLGAMQFLGLGHTAILHALATTFFSFDVPTGRFMQPEIAAAIFPSIIVGFILPRFVELWMLPSTPNWLLAVRQSLPLWLPVIVSVLASRIRSFQERSMSQEQKAERALEFHRYKDPDAPRLRSDLKLAAIIQLSAYVGALVWMADVPAMNTLKALFTIFSQGCAGWGNWDYTTECAAVLSDDVAIANIAWIISNLYSVFDLRRLGYIKTGKAFKVALIVLHGHALCGPGFTWALLWHWREGVFVDLKQQ